MELKQKIMMVLLVFGALLFTGCGGDAYNNPEYSGYTGVSTRILHYPDIQYVYLDQNGNPLPDNTFDVTVELMNNGASISYAGLFLSGYDPHILRVTSVDNDGMLVSGQQVNPRYLGRGNCGFNLGGLGGMLSGILQCSGDWGDFNLGAGAGGLSGGASFNLGNLLDKLGVNQGSWGSVLDLLGGTVSFNDGGFDFSFGSVRMIGTNYMPGAAMLPFISALAGYEFGNFAQLGGIPQLLRGNTRDFPGGDRKYINYEFVIDNWNSAADKMRQDFILTTCYTYSSFASPSVCIDPDPAAVNVDKLCDAYAPVLLSGGQGGPVEITRIVPHPGRHAISFDIFFKHSGPGKVYEVGKIGMCSPFNADRVSERVLDVVFPAVVAVQGNNRLIYLDCSPSGLVRLNNGEGRVTCRYDFAAETGMDDTAIFASRNGYRTPLLIELWYGYSMSEWFSIDFYRGL